jgi:hypothetical protein
VDWISWRIEYTDDRLFVSGSTEDILLIADLKNTQCQLIRQMAARSIYSPVCTKIPSASPLHSPSGSNFLELASKMGPWPSLVRSRWTTRSRCGRHGNEGWKRFTSFIIVGYLCDASVVFWEGTYRFPVDALLLVLSEHESFESRLENMSSWQLSKRLHGCRM